MPEQFSLIVPIGVCLAIAAAAIGTVSRLYKGAADDDRAPGG